MIEDPDDTEHDKIRINRAATLLIEHYKEMALSKAVGAANHYLENNNQKAAIRWVKIGYAIKKIASEEKQPEEA